MFSNPSQMFYKPYVSPLLVKETYGVLLHLLIQAKRHLDSSDDAGRRIFFIDQNKTPELH